MSACWTVLWTKAPFPALPSAPTIGQILASAHILPDLLSRTLVEAHQVMDGKEVGTRHLSAETGRILLRQAHPAIRSGSALIADEHPMCDPHIHQRTRDLSRRAASVVEIRPSPRTATAPGSIGHAVTMACCLRRLATRPAVQGLPVGVRTSSALSSSAI